MKAAAAQFRTLFATEPEVGDTVYLPSEMHLSHGIDDFAGGRATVIEVEQGVSAGQPTLYLRCQEEPDTLHNWAWLAPRQEALRERFGAAVAHPEPDERPRFNRVEDDGPDDA
jgi:hypothetical protein